MITPTPAPGPPTAAGPLGERGIALVMVLLLTLVLSALLLGAAMVAMNAGLIRRYSERLAIAESAALAGLEEGRSRLNGNRALYPDSSGYAVLENGVPVMDATGTPIPGLLRWTYAGPSGVTSGQFGVFGSILSEVRDPRGIRVVRRLEVHEESFARYAYFTDFEPSGICFGAGDQIFGPVHSNANLCIYSSGARFRDVVRTAGVISGSQHGTFDMGFETNVSPIAMPSLADLQKLKSQAIPGRMSFVSPAGGAAEQARLRIEFVGVDLNGDGDITDEDEGFIRVYRGTAGNEGYVVASRTAPITSSPNCGDTQGPHAPLFLAAAQHAPPTTESAQASLANASARCYLGGDPVLTNGFLPVTPNNRGEWLPWTGPVDPRVIAARGAEAAYLHPITRPLNPDFKGVIYVEGKVAVSGTVRSRVTLAASGNVIIADNVRQATDPAVGSCGDILGIVSGGNILIADNSLNAPVCINPNTCTPANSWRTMRPAGNQDEFVHAVLLTLNRFLVQNHATGPTNRESCGATRWGRGCLNLTGGIIQRTRGPVGTTAGTGNLKRYSYNACAQTDPPPYFPTTGRFSRNRFYVMNPSGFDPAAWYSLYQQ
jgi:hypothetical protein